MLQKSKWGERRKKKTWNLKSKERFHTLHYKLSPESSSTDLPCNSCKTRSYFITQSIYHQDNTESLYLDWLVTASSGFK